MGKCGFVKKKLSVRLSETKIMKLDPVLSYSSCLITRILEQFLIEPYHLI